MDRSNGGPGVLELVIQGSKFPDNENLKRNFGWLSHTFLVMILISPVILHVTWWGGPMDTMDNTRKVFIAIVITLVLVSVRHTQDGLSVLPHPAIWKCVMIVYIILLLFALFQTADDAHQLLKLYDPELGVPITERAYADDCRIYTPDHPDGVFAIILENIDMYAINHFIGWFVKGLIFRDVWILMILSFGFEVVELTVEWQLPDLQECWWDHLILDFVICNGLGIYLGMKTCEYLSLKTYNWSGLWGFPSTFKKKFQQNAPGSNFQFVYTHNFFRFLRVMFIIFISLLQEINIFYLKTVLWIPAGHPLNVYRMIVYGVCGACGLSETYKCLQSREPKVYVKYFSWLFCIALTVETLVIIKFGWEILMIPIPQTIVTGWALFFLALSIWAIWKFTVPQKEMPFLRQLF